MVTRSLGTSVSLALASLARLGSSAASVTSTRACDILTGSPAPSKRPWLPQACPLHGRQNQHGPMRAALFIRPSPPQCAPSPLQACTSGLHFGRRTSAVDRPCLLQACAEVMTWMQNRHGSRREARTRLRPLDPRSTPYAISARPRTGSYPSSDTTYPAEATQITRTSNAEISTFWNQHVSTRHQCCSVRPSLGT